MQNQPVKCASDLMERDVIVISPETRILDLHRLFIEEEIHGAPVVGDDGAVVGVVSTQDLLKIVRDELEPGAGATVSTYFREQLPYSGPDWQGMPEDFQDRMQELTAADAMTRELVTVNKDASIEELAQTMLDHHVHRVLVTDEGALCGIVSTFDLLRVLAPQKPPRIVEHSTIRHTGYSR
jgi:CBS domain-containing protein